MTPGIAITSEARDLLLGALERARLSSVVENSISKRSVSGHGFSRADKPFSCHPEPTLVGGTICFFDFSAIAKSQRGLKAI
jgi:hypothetical protein